MCIRDSQDAVRIANQLLIDLHLTASVDDLIVRLNGGSGEAHRLLALQHAVADTVEDEAQLVRATRRPQRRSFSILNEELEEDAPESDTRRQLVTGQVPHRDRGV